MKGRAKATALVPLACGAVFGIGACVSGMVRPSKVLGFLDVGGLSSGTWDPTLAVVMAVALTMTAVAWRLCAARARPAFGDAYPEPASKVIDARLLGGSALFGVGWGLAGFCPGPAVVATVSGATDTIAFVAAMVAGMAVVQVLERAGEDEPIG